MHKSNTMLKAVSLLAAIVLWLYVMGEVDPETRSKIGDIPVSLVNTEVLAAEGLAPVYEEQLTVSATVSGKRSDVNEAKKNGLSAYIDVSNCDEGKNEVRIVISLPDGISLENSSQSTMTLKVDDLVHKTVPVEIGFAETENVQDKVPWVLEQYPQQVTVTGAERSVDKIKKVTGTIETEKAISEKSKWVATELVPVTGENKELYSIEISVDSAEVRIQMLSVKAVDLVLDTVKLSDEEKTLIKGTERIRIAAAKNTIKSINEVKGKAEPAAGGGVEITTELPEGVFLLIGEENGKIIWN